MELMIDFAVLPTAGALPLLAVRAHSSGCQA